MELDLFDTHCHIHAIGGDEKNDFTAKKWREAGVNNADKVIGDARGKGVSRLICVGTDLADSERAVNFTRGRDNTWAAVGVHPHETADFNRASDGMESLKNLIKNDKSGDIVAVGEIGLDYFHQHSSPQDQRRALENQLQLAREFNLPVIFHVRQAHQDFWPILDNFGPVKGVLHSFSATKSELEQAFERGLYIGLNGIMTFSQEENHREVVRRTPAESLLLETDAPYLTPKPFRGRICKPEHVLETAKFVAEQRGAEVEQIASVTTKNACNLFKIKR